MSEVTIEYCVPCGLLNRAMQTQRELLQSFGRELEAVRLETGEGGVFRISVEGETIYDKEVDEGFDIDEIKAEIRQTAVA